MNTKICGNAGEQKACDYLSKKGYEILQRNWRTKRVEIDIIAKEVDEIVFIEVKTLPSGNLETLSHLLNKRKQKRIVETAKCFLERFRKYNSSYIRFDVIIIDMPEFRSTDEFPDVYHIKSAFYES